MKTGQCQCGNRLFFGNFSCLQCNRTVGRCDPCETLTGFDKQSDGSFVCAACRRACHPCDNREQLACNSLIGQKSSRCRWCQFTSVTPDLTQSNNVARWVELERAKRRLLIELHSLNLPPFLSELSQTHPLSFQFLEDVSLPGGSIQKVLTGHDCGVIVVNALEADSVHRESVRVSLGEPQRTLIGHMRHEAGHYIDWSFASRVAPQEYNQLFGDPGAVNYDLAMQNHYQHGAPPNWAESFVSAYATMHPWEDFAETVNVYLDIMAIGETANDQGLARIDLTAQVTAQSIVKEILRIATMVSEFNFDFGLLPLLPERLRPKVIDKLAYVHRLRSTAMVERLRSLSKPTVG